MLIAATAIRWFDAAVVSLAPLAIVFPTHKITFTFVIITTVALIFFARLMHRTTTQRNRSDTCEKEHREIGQPLFWNDDYTNNQPQPSSDSKLFSPLLRYGYQDDASYQHNKLRYNPWKCSPKSRYLFSWFCNAPRCHNLQYTYFLATVITITPFAVLFPTDLNKLCRNIVDSFHAGTDRECISALLSHPEYVRM